MSSGEDFDFGMFGPQPTLPSLDFPDVLPTHPDVQTSQSTDEEYDRRVHVREFVLAKEEQREELEEILTKIQYGQCVELKQRWANDKEGFTVVALCWIELIPKRRAKQSGDPWATHGANPGIPDGEYPGTGAVVDPSSGETAAMSPDQQDAGEEDPGVAGD